MIFSWIFSAAQPLDRDLPLPEPGDLLAVYTDGLNETSDASDTELGHEAIEGKDRVKSAVLPAGPAAVTWHHGSYHELADLNSGDVANNTEVAITILPEPGTAVLLALGLGGLSTFRRD